MSDSNTEYMKLITSEYSKKELFNRYVYKFLDMLSPTVDNLEDFVNIFNIDEAVGDQLDKLGELVGISRTLPLIDPNIPTVLDDDLYRLVIKARIIRNKWNGTIEQLNDLAKIVVPDAYFTVVDNQDMTMDLVIFGYEPTDEFQALFENGYIFPKPAGVRTYYTISEEVLFGWDKDEETIKGWDEGTWV